MPATRYDEIFEVAADFMNPPTVSAAMESGKEEEWTAAMEAELQSLWKTSLRGGRQTIGEESHRYEVGFANQN